jgi:hypothetical protein
MQSSQTPIRNNPNARWFEGILYVPIHDATTVYCVLIVGREPWVAGVYDQRSLAMQHMAVMMSPMRLRGNAKPILRIVECRVSSIAGVQEAVSSYVKDYDKSRIVVIQMKHIILDEPLPDDAAGFHVFNSLVPNIV